MAFDLANRSYMLNKHCDSTGLCIIDEIELHLHPSLAQEVLTRFKRAFPKMQFVVTTHSPLVLTRLSVNRENLLYSLSKDKEDVVFELISEDLYGVDANRILKGSMEAEVRSSDVQRLMDCIQDNINNKQIDQARKVLKDLERMTSENHQAVVRMSALLHRMEVIGK